jgi:branched-chain amino acid transport system substrate-binding protein
MTRRMWLGVAAAVFALTSCTSGSAGSAGSAPASIRIGAVYPLSGSQGPGGRDEYRGVQIATDLVNSQGGVDGAAVQLQPVNVPLGEDAPAAIDQLANTGIGIVLGSYGTTISQPAALEAAQRGMLFWETGAVGSMPPPGGGSADYFRVAPSGANLGRDAVDFISHRLAPMLGQPASTLRFGVVSVDDAYGATVASGAIDEIHALHLPFAGQFNYNANRFDAHVLIHRVARSHPDVLFVAAYLRDGIAIRRAMVDERLPLVANIGTSSSYCMPAFGDGLGKEAVGLFASDKLDGEYVNRAGLTASGRTLLREARSAYEDRFHLEMSAAALSGFSAAWALFHSVMPEANADTPGAVAAAAVATRLPVGSLPNGSGLDFAPPGTAEAGSNLRAMSVIWEWVAPRQRAVVWPPRFATTDVRPIRIGV